MVKSRASKSETRKLMKQDDLNYTQAKAALGNAAEQDAKAPQFMVVAVETNISLLQDGDNEGTGNVLGTYGPFDSRPEANDFADKVHDIFSHVHDTYSDEYGLKVVVHEMSMSLPILSEYV